MIFAFWKCIFGSCKEPSMSLCCFSVCVSSNLHSKNVPDEWWWWMLMNADEWGWMMRVVRLEWDLDQSEDKKEGIKKWNNEIKIRVKDVSIYLVNGKVISC